MSSTGWNEDESGAQVLPRERKQVAHRRARSGGLLHTVTQPRNNQCHISIPDSGKILPSALWDKEEEQGRDREDGEWEKYSHLCELLRGKIGFPHLEIQKFCLYTLKCVDCRETYS